MNLPAKLPSSENLPHNLDAEQELLGAILVNNEAFERVQGIVRVEDFHSEAHRRIFHAIALKLGRGEVANPVTLKIYFEKDQLLDAVGGSKYLVRIAAVATTIINAIEYAKVVRELSLRRELLRIAYQAFERASNPLVEEDSGALVTELRRAIDSLDEAGDIEFLWHGDLLKRGLEKANDAYRRGAPIGIPTGIRALDDKVGRLENGNLILLGARPSMGKTALGLFIAIMAARFFRDQHQDQQQGARARCVLFISLEMSEDQVGQRGLAEASGVRYSDMRNGRLTSDDVSHMLLAAKTNDSVPLAYVVERGLNLHKIRQAIRRAKAKHGCGLVVIDYLGLIEGDQLHRGQNITHMVGEISRGLKKMAGQFDLPILALAQLNRDLEKRDDKRPQLSDLRNSGDLEQDADDVWFLYRDEYYLERSQPPPSTPEWEAWEEKLNRVAGEAEIIVAKNRHGGVGTVRVRMDVARNQIRALDNPSDPRQATMALPSGSNSTPDLPDHATDFAPL
ncbi:MAG: AAA family ATPase [Ferrovibrio sp.]|nr:AAA family ATPase [Ferrovibrio sp.]